jgi:hypothetical protein
MFIIIKWHNLLFIEYMIKWLKTWFSNVKMGSSKKPLLRKHVLILLVINLDILKSLVYHDWLVKSTNVTIWFHLSNFVNKKPFFSYVCMAPHWRPWNSIGGLYIVQDVIFPLQISWVSMWHMSTMCSGSMQSHNCFKRKRISMLCYKTKKPYLCFVVRNII